jgi:GNAT superfamily N-acetyltransferase
MRWATRDERPDLPDIPESDVWPEYNLHGDVVGALWPRLQEEVPQFQSVCWDEDSGGVLAEAHTVPCWWDATDFGLGSGIDETMTDAFALLDRGETANTLCALAAKVAPAARSRGLAAEVVRQMRRIATAHGLTAVIAPVRPSWKARYPLFPIAEYVTWRRTDGKLFDPWMRVHERLGARMGPPLPRSLRITGTVGEWEQWIEMPLPASGRYVFPNGLVPLHVDRDADQGEYWEPNVWFIHAA